MYGVLTAMLLKVKVFRDVIPHYLASSSQRFEESWYLHIWGQVLFLACLIQKMKILQSFKMPQATHARQSVTSQKTWIKYSDVSHVLVPYCLEDCKYSKTPILYCCILVFCNLFTSCIVPVKCPQEQCSPDFMLSQIICHFRCHIQKHNIRILLYF